MSRQVSTLGAYSFAEAARYVRAPAATVRAWFLGMKTGIPTEILYQRCRGGDTVSVLAGDYEISSERVQEAIRFEEDLRAGSSAAA